MRILIATGLYPPEIGGPATYATMLEQELPPRGFAITVVPFGWVRRYPKLLRHVAYAYKLWQERKNIDIIYALDPVSVGWPAWLIAKLTRKRFMLRLGGDYAWEQGRIRFGVSDTLDDFAKDPTQYGMVVRALHWLQRVTASKADIVIVPSEYLKSIIVQWGVAPEQIRVVYSALFPLPVASDRASLRSQLAYQSPTIVTAGRLVPWKGFRLVIATVAKLQKEFPDIMLVVVGDGAERGALEALVEKYRLGEHVRFTGSISKDALGAVIKAADLFVLNTAYEGLSHQLLEVMELGVPIVTTTAGGNPELITHEQTGQLIAFNDAYALESALRYLITHPEVGQRYVQSARLRAKDFVKEKVVGDLVTVLHEVYGG